jgi:hypothetical protein
MEVLEMVKIFACEVMREEIQKVSTNREAEIEFLPMGLHLRPHKLGSRLQELVDGSSGCESIVLGFGLCGGAAATLRAKGIPLYIPRVHDCLPFLFGLVDGIGGLRKELVGTFVTSGGWMEGDRTLPSEYRRMRERFGDDKARKLMDAMFVGYSRILFVRTGHPREKAALAASEELAEALGLEHQVTTGSLDFIAAIINGPWDSGQFLRIAPWCEVLEGDFVESGAGVKAETEVAVVDLA